MKILCVVSIFCRKTGTQNIEITRGILGSGIVIYWHFPVSIEILLEDSNAKLEFEVADPNMYETQYMHILILFTFTPYFALQELNKI